jgi:4-aminobutyrate aminotransferase/(S)-3-amino-2-methylpropionate transaminase
MDSVHVGGIGGTYGGNPLACAAALEVMNQFQDGNLLERATSIGGQIRARGAQWIKQFPGIGDVRGLGGMIAIEFVKDRTTRVPDPDAVAKVSAYCLQHGVITMRAGLYTNCIRLLMPLVITDEQLQEGLDVLEAAMKSL